MTKVARIIRAFAIAAVVAVGAAPLLPSEARADGACTIDMLQTNKNAWYDAAITINDGPYSVTLNTGALTPFTNSNGNWVEGTLTSAGGVTLTGSPLGGTYTVYVGGNGNLWVWSAKRGSWLIGDWLAGACQSDNGNILLSKYVAGVGKVVVSLQYHAPIG